MSERLTAQEAWDLAVVEAQFPKGGGVPLILPPSLYNRFKDDPRLARIEMAPNRPLPID